MRTVRNITVCVSPEIYRQTKQLAAKYHTTVSGVVAFLLERLPDALERARYPVGGVKRKSVSMPTAEPKRKSSASMPTAEPKRKSSASMPTVSPSSMQASMAPQSPQAIATKELPHAKPGDSSAPDSKLAAFEFSPVKLQNALNPYMFHLLMSTATPRLQIL
jgi:hypothetical protein